MRCFAGLKRRRVSVSCQVREFVQEKLGPQFGRAIRSASELRNSVSQEAKLFNSVSLAVLDRRIVDG